jgi:circadian clock protein KaiB
MKEPIDSIEDFENAAPKAPNYLLRLYVAGATRQSLQAIRSIRLLCEERLLGRYVLEVVDVYQQPQLARDDQILAVPTLIKRLPMPLRKLVGDLSNKERVLLGLDLKTRTTTHGKKKEPRRR